MDLVAQAQRMTPEAITALLRRNHELECESKVRRKETKLLRTELAKRDDELALADIEQRQLLIQTEKLQSQREHLQTQTRELQAQTEELRAQAALWCEIRETNARGYVFVGPALAGRADARAFRAAAC